MLKKQPFEIVFLYVNPLLNWKICQRRPPPQEDSSHRGTWELYTAWARATQLGVSPPASGKLTSAAVMAAMPQKAWSSLPSVWVWFRGM